MHSWLTIPAHSDFSVHNLPFGIYSTSRQKPQVGVAIGDQIINLAAVSMHKLLHDLAIDPLVFNQASLNPLIALGKPVTQALRQQLQPLLTDPDSPLRAVAGSVLVPQADARMHLPVTVGDYTDFYSSEEHATRVGTMFRGAENALPPNWKHLPIAYHGRASSIVVSGTPVQRPCGQTMPPGATQPQFGPTQQLDFELELAFVVGKETALGHPIRVADAEDHIFGLLLFNDWSARDVQRWEYQPLGPFLGKNFASSVSPWVVTLEALRDFRVAGPVQFPKPLPYLQSTGDRNFNIQLEVALQPKGQLTTTVSRTNARSLYWNIAQQLAHHTVNGCNVRVGDLMASGTISGKDPQSAGSMLELTHNGKQPRELDEGGTRTFIEDHDTVVLRGHAEQDGKRVGFGQVRTQILPAHAHH
jgi:fumarylacetoacetase